MNCFQLIKTVLDEAYAQIPGSVAEKDEAIRTELGSLSKAYANLLNAGCIDYAEAARRFAYIYRYTTTHANLVYSLFRKCPEAGAFFKSDKVSLCAIGGGPGSDFLGALKYCEAAALSPELRCLLLDRDPAWGESWIDVDEKIAANFNLKTVFQPLDVTNPSSYKAYVKYFSSDIFTLIYFMSEVYASRVEAADYFASLFSNAKTGSLFLFADNNDSRFYGWFDRLAEQHGIDIIDKSEGLYQLPPAEEKTDLGTYYAKFDAPKLSGDIAYRIGIKR